MGSHRSIDFYQTQLNLHYVDGKPSINTTRVVPFKLWKYRNTKLYVNFEMGEFHRVILYLSIEFEKGFRFKDLAGDQKLQAEKVSSDTVRLTEETLDHLFQQFQLRKPLPV